MPNYDPYANSSRSNWGAYLLGGSLMALMMLKPTVAQTEENKRQVSQSLQTLKDKLNTSYQQELKNEQDAFNYFLS